MTDSDMRIFESIIIVEDDKGLNRLMEKKLSLNGYKTISVFSGEEAIEVIRKNQNSLLFTDYILPDMDAKELIENLTETGILIPFIVTTGRGDEKLAVEMMKNGALDYISKESGFLDLLPEITRQAEKKVATERRLELTEKALKASERNFSQIVKRSGNGIFVRQDGRFVMVNPSLARSVEYTQKELMSEDLNIFHILHGESKNFVRNLIRNSILKESFDRNFELVVESKSGKLINFEVTLAAIEWNGRSASLGILTDVTEFHKLKTEMIKAAKNESINILAGGLAHDFNNVLSVVLGNLILVSSRLEKGQEVSELINSIEETIAAGTGLTRQLLSFSKDEELDTDIVSMRQLLKRTVRFTASGSKLKITYNLQKDLSPVRVDRNQIVQVITNLVINAKQAMADGGELIVTAENCVIGDGNENKFLQNGKYVKVILRDTGEGVPEQLQEKIFEPFFTTKSTGQGLGLATCLTILKRHNGWMELENHLEGGAVFTFYLPAINAMIEKTEAPAANCNFSGKILVMDDIRDVRIALQYIFSDLGLNVDIAENGSIAYDMITACSPDDPYDLVIADLTVKGGFGAVRLLEKTRENNIDVKILVYSGYTNKEEIKDPQKFGFVDSFVKPFSINELKNKLNKILNG